MKEYTKYDETLDSLVVGIIFTLNLIFNIFVFNKYDLSPNIAIGLISIIIIYFILRRIFRK